MNFSKITFSKLSKTIGFILDNFLPPIIRDSRVFYPIIIKLWNSKMDIDFKRKAFYMTPLEFSDAYEKLVPMRSTDNTQKTVEFVLTNIKGNSVLEIGCGNGDISIDCAKMGYFTTATDIAEGNIKIVKQKSKEKDLNISTSVENVEELSYKDNSFDTVICLHTLEHVVNLQNSISELKRVCIQRVIIIVPKQKYFKYTADYHLNFFGEPEQLSLAMGIKNSKCIEIDKCLCFYGDLC